MTKNLLKIEKKKYKRKFILTDDDSCEALYIRFKTRYPAFLPTLRRSIPGITRKEEELCIFIILNQSSTEIARRMNILKSSVNMTRHRLRQRLGLSTPESLKKTVTDLFDILS